jgi:hypothetical protein
MRPQAWFVLFGLLLPAIGSQTVYAIPGEIVPAGTILNVRTTQPIYANYTQPGARFSGIIDDPVQVGGRIVIPRGTPATLEVVGVNRSSNLKGRDRVSLRVRSIRIGGANYPVSTSYVELKGPSEGKRAARKAIGGAGVGAVIGGLLGGGTGAAIGATAGATTGVAVAGSGKTYLSVPAETVLQFQLNGSTRIAR